MNVRGKEYQTLKPEELSLRQVKTLQLTVEAYDEFAKATSEDEAAKYEKFKVLWKSLASSIVLSPDEVVKDVDNITVPVLSEFIRDFFPKSSEAAK